jgi:hypothetical protein
MVLFYVISTTAIDRHTIHSTLAVWDDFPHLTPAEREQLEAMDIRTVDDLLWETRTSARYHRVLDQLRVSPDRLEELIGQARMIDLKGLGIRSFLLLQRAGIDSVGLLAQQDPGRLYGNLLDLKDDSTGPLPTRAKIKLWVLAARRQETR